MRKVFSYFCGEFIQKKIIQKMYETIIERIKERLTGRELRAVIIPHISPDGDAAGSCSALWQVLDKVGIQAQLMT